MNTDTQKRNQILRRIFNIPSDKLKELDDFVTKLGQSNTKRSNPISFAGAWKNIDDSVFNDFTDNLIHNRQRNNSRIDE